MQAEPDIQIRDAAPRDAERVALMANRLARQSVGRVGDMTPDRVVSDLIEGPGLNLIVADQGGSAIGYALYTVAYETAYAARGSYLTDLYVIAEARRQGAALALLRSIAKRTVADGGRYVWWVAMPTNPDARAFYDALDATKETVLARALFDAPFERLLC